MSKLSSCGLILFFLFFFSTGGFGAGDTIMLGVHEIPVPGNLSKATATGPEEVIRGFPVLLNVRVEQGEGNFQRWGVVARFSVLDLGWGGPGLEPTAYFFDGQKSFYEVRKCRSPVPFGPGFPYEDPAIGETLSLWFDLDQLFFRRGGGVIRSEVGNIGAVRQFLEVGDWEVVLSLKFDSEWVVGPIPLRIRDPNPDEQEFLDALKEPGLLGPRKFLWFPELVLATKELPATALLPPETRRIVDIVEILRAAVRSEEEGLKVISSKSDVDWGYLRGFVEEIRYECALKVWGLEKTRHEFSKMNAADRRKIEDGNGIVAQMRRVRKEKEEVRQIFAEAAKRSQAGDPE